MWIMIRMVGSLLSRAAVWDFGIQGAAWAAATLLKTEKFYDFTGSFFYKFLREKTVLVMSEGSQSLV